MRKLWLPVTLAALGASLFFPAPAFAYDGKLRVKCNVPAKVYINKIHIGKTGEIISGLPFGRCRMWVVADGYKKHEQMVEILGNDVIEVKVTLKLVGDDSTDTDEEPSSDEEDSGEEEPKKEDKEKEEKEKEGKEKEKPKKFNIKETRKASKEGDNDRLRDILSSDSGYLVRVVTAAALVRLKSKGSVDFIDGEINTRFSDAPVEWFGNSPFYGPYRALADTASIVEAFDEKEVMLNTFERLIPGYAAVLTMKDKQKEYRKECRTLQRRMAKLKKNKPDGWWGQHSQCDHDMRRMAKDIKDYSAFVTKTLSILKKLYRSKEDKDLVALAKYFHDHAKGKHKD